MKSFKSVYLFYIFFSLNPWVIGTRAEPVQREAYVLHRMRPETQWDPHNFFSSMKVISRVYVNIKKKSKRFQQLYNAQTSTQITFLNLRFDNWNTFQLNIIYKINSLHRYRIQYNVSAMSTIQTYTSRNNQEKKNWRLPICQIRGVAFYKCFTLFC